MSSREAILRAIRENRPARAPLPDPVTSIRPELPLEDAFARVVESGGGMVVRLDGTSAEAAIRAAYPHATQVGSAVPRLLQGSVSLEDVADPHELATLDVYVCEGELGVAENGAIWLPESRLVHRAAPFITQHLVIVVDRRKLVWEMQEAYAATAVNQDGYGVFIAGPSKTADIEQQLVIGAHGPRSLTVLLE